MSPFDIIAITLPISLLMALGAVSVWRGWFPAEAIPGFGKFVRNMALPSAVFLAVSQRDFSEIIHPGFILAFGGASLFSLCLSLLVARGVLRQPLSLAGIVGLAGGVSNALMIGLPLVVALYGVDAMAAIAQQLIVETAFLIPLGLLIADFGQRREMPGGTEPGALLGVLLRTFWGVLTNPLIVALGLGLVVSVLGLSLPGALVRSVELLAASVGGMALFFIGVTLFGVDLRAEVRGVLPAIGIKAVLHPLVMALSFWLVLLGWKAAGWMPVPAVMANCSVIIATLPSIGILPAIAARYGHERTISLALLVMTVISVLTTPLTIWLLLTFEPFV